MNTGKSIFAQLMDFLPSKALSLSDDQTDLDHLCKQLILFY